MKITLSKRQWEKIGSCANWIKKSQFAPSQQGQQQGAWQSQGTWQSPTALPDTANSMMHNLRGVSNQLQGLMGALDGISKGNPISQPESLATMMDEMTRSLQDTKKFVPTLIRYIQNQQQQ